MEQTKLQYPTNHTVCMCFQRARTFLTNCHWYVGCENFLCIVFIVYVQYILSLTSYIHCPWYVGSENILRTIFVVHVLYTLSLTSYINCPVSRVLESRIYHIHKACTIYTASDILHPLPGVCRE